MPKSTSNPATIQATDYKRQTIMLLRQGVDTRSIAAQLNIAEEYVRNIAREDMEYLSLATQEIQEHFVAMTFARSEKIMSRIMPDFDIDPPPMPDNIYDREAMKTWQDDVKYWRRMVAESAKNWALVTRVQKDILQVHGVVDKKDGINVEKMQVNNITMKSGDDFYAEALEHIQRNHLGESFPEMQSRLLEESIVIETPYDERLAQVEQAVEKLHAIPDPDDEQTDP